MTKRVDVQNCIERMEWIARLPEGGGAWGNGLLETARSVAQEIVELEDLRSSLGEKIKKRAKVLRALPARADRESELMFSPEEISAAQQGGESHRPG